MYNEPTDYAIRRVAKNETGLDVEVIKPIGTYGDPLIERMFWTKEKGWLAIDFPKKCLTVLN